MKKFMLVAAIASLSIVNAGLAQAQAVIGEPGMFAFYHPDADVLQTRSGPTGYRIDPRNAQASAPVATQVRGHRQAPTR